MSMALWNPEESKGLTDADSQRVLKAWTKAYSGATYRVYGSLWKGFVESCSRKGVNFLPASPAVVAAYLAEKAEGGASWSSLSTINAAIRKFHEDNSLESPTVDRRLKRVRKGIRNSIDTIPEQVKGLTRDVFIQIALAGWEPRPGESPERASLRAVTDIAIIALMRDCLLRRSEAAQAKWEDLESLPRGHGALNIRRSKTDQRGKGKKQFVSAYTMVYLLRMLDVRGGLGPKLEDPIFGIGDRQICNRIQQAAKQAELPGRYAGHSPRIGMAQDLAEGKAEMPSLMQAGRWSSGGTVYRYIANSRTANSVVALYYEMVEAGVID